MEDEQLIELVRENSKYKNNLWNKIGAEINLDGETCKSRWNNIRDNYRKSLKKTDTKSGQMRTNVKLYKYHEQLNFLKKFFIERKRKESVNTQEEDLELQKLEDEEDNQTQSSTIPISDVASTLSPSHVASTPSTNYALTPSPSHVSTPSPSHVSTPSPSHKPGSSSNHESTPSPRHLRTPSPNHVSTPSPLKKKKGAKIVQQKTAASSLMEYVLQKNQARAELTQHPVDAFLNGIAPTLKSLNQYYLHLAKSEIFATVQKYEMTMMTEQSVTLLPGVDIANVPTRTVVQADRTSQSISLSNSTATPPEVNSTTLANVIDNTTQVHQQHNTLHDFVNNYSDTQ